MVSVYFAGPVDIPIDRILPMFVMTLLPGFVLVLAIVAGIVIFIKKKAVKSQQTAQQPQQFTDVNVASEQSPQKQDIDKS